MSYRDYSTNFANVEADLWLSFRFHSITDVGFWSGARLDGYVVESTTPSPSSPSPSELISQYFKSPVLLVMKGPVRRAVEATPAFPQLEARAQFQDGYPLFIASEESLKDLQGYVSVSASGKDEKWRVGKIDKEAWKNGERLKMERYVLFVSQVARLRFGADRPPLAFVLLFFHYRVLLPLINFYLTLFSCF